MNKVDPWSVSEVKDYGKLLEEFGMSSIEEYKKRFDSFHYIRRGIIFGHRDLGKIVKALDGKKPFAMMTGLMPSGRFHLGHKMVADEIIWFQSLGAETFICAADVESYLMRDISFENARETALEEYLANYIALGLSEKKLHFWFQSDYINPYYRLRDMCSKRVTFNELKAIYGELTPGKITSALTQAADILHPQLDVFGGPKPTVVPVGADQDPHIRLTRDIASRLSADRAGCRDFDCIPPSATYHKFMSGLTGGKMSSSDPKSYIALREDPASASKKVLSAKTGGRETFEEQKKKGGQPESCSVYELYLYHLVKDDLELSKIYHECGGGEIMCGECKKRCAKMMSDLLSEHQRKIPSALKRAQKLIGKT
ncbi:MAG: tryptophan--tRNA ligase [Candidatus Altiarchaeota archaeon]|nr:tryptophan--tRNA ligase [Candidatus Altiarchaeota archaeon]